MCLLTMRVEIQVVVKGSAGWVALKSASLSCTFAAFMPIVQGRSCQVRVHAAAALPVQSLAMVQQGDNYQCLCCHQKPGDRKTHFDVAV